MSIRKADTTEANIEKKIKKGRGQGEKEKYKPWIMVGDFSNKGRGHRIHNPFTRRTHHLLSDLEANYFYILLWDDRVIDIREQFPLFPRSETEEIAESFGYRHPCDPRTKVNIIMTTDYLITFQDGQDEYYLARSIKYKTDLKKADHKLQIEQEYWRKRNIDWKIITEDRIVPFASTNIKNLLGHFNDPHSYKLLNKVYYSLTDAILRAPEATIAKVCASVEIQSGMETGSVLPMFYYFCAHKLIPVNIEFDWENGCPVKNQIDLEHLLSLKEEDYYGKRNIASGQSSN